MTTDIKQTGAIITAIVSFLCGWGLTIAGFCVEPTGEVTGSVLAVLGEAMLYTASVFGVTMYFSSQSKRLKEEIKSYIEGLTGNNEETEEI